MSTHHLAASPGDGEGVVTIGGGHRFVRLRSYDLLSV